MRTKILKSFIQENYIFVQISSWMCVQFYVFLQNKYAYISHYIEDESGAILENVVLI
jgi:hypothetical protein